VHRWDPRGPRAYRRLSPTTSALSRRYPRVARRRASGDDGWTSSPVPKVVGVTAMHERPNGYDPAAGDDQSVIRQADK